MEVRGGFQGGEGSIGRGVSLGETTVSKVELGANSAPTLVSMPG